MIFGRSAVCTGSTECVAILTNATASITMMLATKMYVGAANIDADSRMPRRLPSRMSPIMLTHVMTG